MGIWMQMLATPQMTCRIPSTRAAGRMYFGLPSVDMAQRQTQTTESTNDKRNSND